ncbi:HIT family protein [Francisella adeliensis]|uniref:HIT family protein n=1 Tax=Francisella adeliensis TaxID=2007306 RepID=A0A2Z4XYW9_9GAMM|nr:HIT family protein [Francisella adeliensis]AXA33989.1 HIT family protein [Francisella adeliensis]MBK2085901.1 HIT family protein [Francisella adeliensis]MBK2097779.1 HIT family protein [Francisella adeliensis]QIW12226.1 HIT family protein [Francisella adeliensis]QIW14102.1 HIT family protein [Francisella adeliensis]
MFELDERLANDTIEVCEYLDCKILVMNNANLPWFIVVPFTERVEWYELDDSVQYNINKIINKLSKLLKDQHSVDKINVATIGNVVKQMHIHVVGRFEDDSVWPAPVWGNIESKEYTMDQKQKLIQEVRKSFS